MEDVAANQTKEKQQKPKKHWWRGLRAEYKKIVWPDKDTLIKESAAVIVITIILSLVIVFVDNAVGYGIGLLI